MINYKKVFFSFSIIALSLSTYAQNSTNSPYTRFGYGKLVDAGFGRTNAMGGTGFGIRSKSSINPANPAAYSEIDSITFLFEFGFSGLLSSYAIEGASTDKFTGNIDYFAMQFPISKRLGMSAGIIPYSFSGYKYGFQDSVLQKNSPATDSVYWRNNQNFSGTGSISQVYIGLSFDVLKNLSLGINGYYMFGSLKNNRSLVVSSSDNAYAYASYETSELRVKSFNTRFGVQYKQPVNQKRDLLIIGAIYEFQHKLNSIYSTQTIGLDTLTTEGITDAFQLPNVYGLGVTYLMNDRLTLGADFQLQQFKSTKYQGVTDTLNNRMKIAAGVEYIHKPNGIKYFDRIRWRIGGNYSNSYININNRTSTDFALTAGVGLPFKTIKSILNINLEYGQFGTTKYSMIKENYFRVGINFTLNENWFLKPRIQ
jgi:hypothetical protein